MDIDGKVDVKVLFEMKKLHGKATMHKSIDHIIEEFEKQVKYPYKIICPGGNKIVYEDGSTEMEFDSGKIVKED